MPSVIQLCGTSGAGKSTVVRRVLATPGVEREPVFAPGRTSPIGYRLRGGGLAGTPFLVGAYGAPTGGCDTVKDTPQAFALVEEYFQQGVNVLFEGLFVMNHTRGPLLARSVGVSNFNLVRLTTPLDVCFKRIDERRAAIGKGPLDHGHDNIEGNNTRAVNYVSKMGFLGVKVHRCSSDDAVALVLGLLRAPLVAQPGEAASVGN